MKEPNNNNLMDLSHEELYEHCLAQPALTLLENELMQRLERLIDDEDDLVFPAWVKDIVDEDVELPAALSNI